MNKRHFAEKCFALTTRLSLLLCAAVLLFLLGSILFQGIGAMSLEFLFTPAREFGKSGGIFYQLFGSLLIVLIGALLVLPLAFGTALFRNAYNSNSVIARVMDQSLYALNAIPSVTYGIFGLIFFVNFLGAGISWFVGSVILAIMMLPTVTLSTSQAMAAIPKIYNENAAALGLAKKDIIRRVTLPQSFHGVVTGLLISLARAIGETAPIMFIATAFSGVKVPNSLVEPVSTLPTHILELAQQSTDPQALQNAWGASLTLILLAAIFSGLALFLRRRLNREGRSS
ncbi:phosphate ABC transporter permease PstA [Hellea balneolensis]|uniref:phosphate ABC transporter permease PstA n=1 Tax=Hellea balneolensis TaxID=287478 RepID=UPI00047B9225|nr:phosphate ABC transporter permease PstA [Hellea balneolensis]